MERGKRMKHAGEGMEALVEDIVQKYTEYDSYKEFKEGIKREAIEYLKSKFPTAVGYEKIRPLDVRRYMQQERVCANCNPSQCPWCGWEVIIAEKEGELLVMECRCTSWLYWQRGGHRQLEELEEEHAGFFGRRGK
jgi:hypothetical protein